MASKQLEISGTRAEFSPSSGTARTRPETHQRLKDTNQRLPLEKAGPVLEEAEWALQAIIM